MQEQCLNSEHTTIAHCLHRQGLQVGELLDANPGLWFAQQARGNAQPAQQEKWFYPVLQSVAQYLSHEVNGHRKLVRRPRSFGNVERGAGQGLGRERRGRPLLARRTARGESRAVPPCLSNG